MAAPTRMQLMTAIKAALEGEEALHDMPVTFGRSFDNVEDVERASPRFPALMIVYAGGKGERSGMAGNVSRARRIEIYVCARTLKKDTSHQEAAIEMLEAIQAALAENDLGFYMSPLELVEDWAELITEKYAIYGMAFETEMV